MKTHLGTTTLSDQAMTYDDELEGIVTYDDRLAEAAARHRVAVLAPS